MPAPKNFRTAFNGFNREDVVCYLEYLKSRHASEVNQLKAEAEGLRAKLDTFCDRQLEKRDCTRLEEENATLRQRIQELEQEKYALAAQLTQQQEPADYPAQELEAYRRAERTERVARERAEQVYSETSTVLTQASNRIEAALRQMTGISQQVTGQLDTLQTAIASSRLALQDAAQTIDKLKPSR